VTHFDTQALVLSLLRQGFTVCYLDADPDRLKAIKAIGTKFNIDRDTLVVVDCSYISGQSGPHYSAVVAVNMHEWSVPNQTDWLFIADSNKTHRACTFKVEL